MQKRAKSGRTANIDKSIQKTCKETTDIIGEQIADTYRDSYYRTWYELQSETGHYFTPPKLTTPQLNAYLAHKIKGKNWRDRLKGHYRDYAKDIRNIINNGKRAGISDEEIQQMVLAKTGKLGESGMTYKMQRILRTQSNHAVNAAMLSVFKRAGIEYYTYNAQLDDKDCKVCDELHRKSHRRPYKRYAFKVKEAKARVNLPPLHPNCRCYIEPIITDEAMKKLEKGEKRRKLSYRTWYREYVEQVRATDLRAFSVNGITYEIDGRNVTLDYTEHEKRIALLISERYGKPVQMVPRISGCYKKIQTPDFLLDNKERWDLKELKGKDSDDPIRNAVHKKKHQARHFVIDITKSKKSTEELLVLADEVFIAYNTKFVETLILVKSNKIIYERHRT